MIPSRDGRKSVVIVGGGFTGLTAAYALSAGGDVKVRIIERASELGGLAAGFSLQGTSIEKTYHHLFLTDRAILALVEELGLSEKLLWCDSSLGIFYGGRIYPFMSPGDLLRFTPCDFLSRIRVGLVVLYLQRKKDWQRFVAQAAFKWMSRACGPSAMRAIWTPLLKGKFGRYFDVVSMAWLWARIHTRANSRGKTSEREQLGYFRGGFEAVVRKLESELVRRDVTIQRGRTVEKIVPAERVLLVGGERVPFDACIFTGPGAAFAKLLPETPELRGYREQLESITYIGAVCLVFVSEQDIGEQYWLNINEEGAPFLVFIHHTRLIDKANYNGKHVYYLGAYEPHDGPLFAMSDDQIAESWFAFLRKIYPLFDPARVLEKHVFKLRSAQHIVDAGYRERIPDYRTPLAGVYLANFAQVFPEDRGTNFAVREGQKIASLVRDDLQREARA